MAAALSKYLKMTNHALACLTALVIVIMRTKRKLGLTVNHPDDVRRGNDKMTCLTFLKKNDVTMKDVSLSADSIPGLS